MRWRYAKEIVRTKIASRDLTDSLVGRVLLNPASMLSARKLTITPT